MRPTFLPIVLGVIAATAISPAPAVAAPAPAAPAAPGGAPPGAPAPFSPPPSAFDSGIDGFDIDIAAGLAGGYLVAREGGLHTSDWRPLVAGAGIGALAGGALGLTLGLVSTDPASQGRSYLIVREMGRGGQFGLLTGGIIGGLVALGNDKPETILFGAAIGTLSGTALGLVLGSLEHNPWAPARVGPVALQAGVLSCQTVRGGVSFGPGVLGRF